MKKAVLIIGGVIVAMLVGLIALMYYVFSKAESDKNKSRTEAAREARWKPKTETLVVSEEGITDTSNQN